MKYLKKVSKLISIKILQIVNIFMNITNKLHDNRILFLSDVRGELGGNLKSMYDYIDEKKFEKNVILKSDRRIKRNFKEKLKLLKMISTSKYILLDDFSSTISCMIPRKGQEIVQLWHGAGAFKKFGYSRNDKKKTIFSKYNSHRNYTKALVTSDEIKWCFKEGFGMEKKGEIGSYGFPRTDCFFDDKYITKVRKKFLRKYPFLKNKKIILFAPTYRGTSLPKATYDFDMLNLDEIYNNLKDEYVFIFKWHPAIYNNISRGIINSYDLSKYKNFYYDLSSYRDINDLLLISDILITDYSSVIFDYALLNKPVIYFTYDLELYEKDRGLYFDFKDYLYGDVVKNTKSLIKSVKQMNMCNEKRHSFIKKFMDSCDGNSTKKVYDWIFKN
ncbi:MAG: CDP-glycerol glycerophosphotransferase family protein [bacterium]|nr:CDP-glycerol glycerophosphotransferase family protein [bacterium]